MSDVDKLKKEFAPNNGRFQILTDTGFSDFVGVTKSIGQFDSIKIETNNTSITTTNDHEIFMDDLSCKRMKDICVGDVLYGGDVVEKIDSVKLKTVYDVLHVFNNNRFMISDENHKSSILIKNCLYIDEIAFIPNVEEFYESVFPTISSSNKTKVIITSTPLGMNYFYKMWVEAETGRSAYVPYDVKWYEHPERDQKWYDTMCASMSPTAIEQEMNCVSGDTLIDINGEKVQIEQLYNKFNKSTDNVIAYVNDINICVD